MPDTNKLKPGNIVHVKGIVMEIHRENGGYEIEFRPRHTGPSVPVSLADIVHVEPSPLQVGDEVTWGPRKLNYVIRFIDEDGLAFLRLSRGTGSDYSIQHISQVSRADA